MDIGAFMEEDLISITIVVVLIAAVLVQVVVLVPAHVLEAEERVAPKKIFMELKLVKKS